MLLCSTAPSLSRPEWKMRVVTLSFWISPDWSRFSVRCQKSRAIWRAALPISAWKPTLPWLSIRIRPFLPLTAFPGVIVIPEGKEAEQLGNLPLEVLFAEGHDPPTLEILERWGIRNFRALAALPEIALSERLGQEGIRLQQLARGCSSRTLVPVEPPLNFTEAIELEYPLVLLEPLAFLLAGYWTSCAPGWARGL